jgi:glycogen synthase
MSMTLIRHLNRWPMPPVRLIKDGIRKIVQPLLQLERWKVKEEEFDFAALESPHLLEADEIVAPCRAIADITARMWHLDRSRMVEVPNLFIPPAPLLAIPVETAANTVGYIGRLERRKGVIDLGRAIPLVLKRFPSARFLFAGATQDSPAPGVSMEDYLKGIIGAGMSQVTFMGKVEHGDMDKVFSSMDVTVLPSLWENFPNSCLEAMAAGRGVVGSSAGGMAQQLDEGRAGFLIRPGRPREIANAVCRLLENPELRKEFGRKARARVLSEYNADRVGLLMEQSYERAIRQHSVGRRQWLVN